MVGSLQASSRDSVNICTNAWKISFYLSAVSNCERTRLVGFAIEKGEIVKKVAVQFAARTKRCKDKRRPASIDRPQSTRSRKKGGMNSPGMVRLRQTPCVRFLAICEVEAGLR
jgi:hypothetical protein